MKKKLLAAMAIGVAITGVIVAQTKASAKTLSQSEAKKYDANTATNKAFSRVNMNNLSGLFRNGVSSDIYGTYKTTKPFKVTNEFRHKTVTLPAGTVVSGVSDPNGNLKFFFNTSISTKKQKPIFKKLGYDKSVSYFVNKANGVAKNKYLRNTAYSYHSAETLPILYKKSANSIYDSNGIQSAFITVTADNYLTYHPATTQSNLAYRSAAKIKRFKRTKSSITYYLAKPMVGVSSKKVRVGKSYQYQVQLTIGKVFENRERYNGDPAGYSLTINNNGKPAFCRELGYEAQTYADYLNGGINGGYSKANLSQAEQYVKSLY